MEHKYRHEHHNRQDKALKPDYREDFIAESQAKSSPEHLAHFKKMLALRAKFMTLLQGAKTKPSEIDSFKEQVLLRYYDGVYRVGGFDFRFRWSLKEYIKRNELMDAFNRTYKHHKQVAVRDFKRIEQSIRQSPARGGISKIGQQQPQFTCFIALECDAVIPFRTGEEDYDLSTLFKNAR